MWTVNWLPSLIRNHIITACDNDGQSPDRAGQGGRFKVHPHLALYPLYNTPTSVKKTTKTIDTAGSVGESGQLQAYPHCSIPHSAKKTTKAGAQISSNGQDWQLEVHPHLTLDPYYSTPTSVKKTKKAKAQGTLVSVDRVVKVDKVKVVKVDSLSVPTLQYTHLCEEDDKGQGPGDAGQGGQFDVHPHVPFVLAGLGQLGRLADGPNGQREEDDAGRDGQGHRYPHRYRYPEGRGQVAPVTSVACKSVGGILHLLDIIIDNEMPNQKDIYLPLSLRTKCQTKLVSEFLFCFCFLFFHNSKLKFKQLNGPTNRSTTILTK